MSTTNYNSGIGSTIRKRGHDPIEAGINDPIVNVPEANVKNKSMSMEFVKNNKLDYQRPIQRYSWLIVIGLTILAFATRFYKITSGAFVLYK